MGWARTRATLRFATTVALNVAGIAGAGCGDDVATDAGTDAGARACDEGPGHVELGEGGSRLRFFPATDPSLTIVRGAQGGIHILVGFATRDMELDMRASYRLVDPTTDAVVGTETVRDLRPTLFAQQDGETVRNPDLIVLNNEAADVDTFIERPLSLELTAESAGSFACDAHSVTLLPPL